LTVTVNIFSWPRGSAWVLVAGLFLSPTRPYFFLMFPAALALFLLEEAQRVQGVFRLARASFGRMRVPR
jgi:hypothetical protein